MRINIFIYTLIIFFFLCNIGTATEERIVNGDFSNGTFGWDFSPECEVVGGSARIYDHQGITQHNDLDLSGVDAITFKSLRYNGVGTTGRIRLNGDIIYTFYPSSDTVWDNHNVDVSSYEGVYEFSVTHDDYPGSPRALFMVDDFSALGPSGPENSVSWDSPTYTYNQSLAGEMTGQYVLLDNSDAGQSEGFFDYTFVEYTLEIDDSYNQKTYISNAYAGNYSFFPFLYVAHTNASYLTAQLIRTVKYYSYNGYIYEYMGSTYTTLAYDTCEMTGLNYSWTPPDNLTEPDLPNTPDTPNETLPDNNITLPELPPLPGNEVTENSTEPGSLNKTWIEGYNGDVSGSVSSTTNIANGSITYIATPITELTPRIDNIATQLETNRPGNSFVIPILKEFFNGLPSKLIMFINFKILLAIILLILNR